MIRKGGSITEAIQVCYFIDDEGIKQREIRGLKDAMDSYDLDSGLILTAYQEEVIELYGKRIIISPVWKWL